jgi:hypothetical protein
MEAEASVPELLVLLSAGTALFLIGLIHLLGRGWSWRCKAASTAGIVVTASLVPLAIGDIGLTAAAAGLTVLVAGILTLVTSGGIATVLQPMHSLLRRPAIRSALLAVAGGVLIVAAYVKFDHDDQAAIDRDNAFDEMVVHQPATRDASEVQATTDHGRRIQLREVNEIRPVEFRTTTEDRVLSELHCYGRVIRIAAADDVCNCHGWVFTGGRYWIPGSEVENILTENGYVAVTDPRPGDLAIYRDAKEISHTSIVRAIVNGMPPLVEGKWGWMGVFLHPVGDSIYGAKYTYYRSPREGHLLAGLEGASNSKDGAERLTGAQ